MLAKKEKELIYTDLIKNRKEYSETWEVDAKHFFEKSYYDWMAEGVAESKNILEIGCGAGYSTLALLNNNHKVISIEENSFCIDKTEKLLKSKGFNVAKINNREVYKASPQSRYILEYKNIAKELGEYDVILVQGDIINDPKFIRWLTEDSTFSIDAVVCWLLGTHGSRGSNQVFDLSQVQESSTARIHTQNIIYELCDEMLKENDYLHIVDRVIDVDNVDIVESISMNHEGQASTSKMKVLGVKKMIYEEATKGMSMNIRESTNDSKMIDRKGIYNCCDKLFVSVLSQKMINNL